MLTFLGRGSAFTDEHNSAFFVENDELVLIDCAMSSFEKLNDMNMTLFKHIYVLITHTHGDHVSGLGMLIDLMEFSVKTPITVVAPSKEVENDIRYLLRNIEGCADSWYGLTNASEFKKDWFVCAIPTFHTEQLAGKCFGYSLTVGGNKVVYTGDTNTLEPFEKYLVEGTYAYIEISAYRSPVHLYCIDMHDKIAELSSQGVHVYLMHMDDEKRIQAVLQDTGAELAPLIKGELNFTDIAKTLDNVFEIMDGLYKDTCTNRIKDHTKLFKYITELGKTIVDADRASFWKWDKRRNQLWTMSSTDLDKIVIPDSTGLVGKALRSKSIVVTNDPYSDPDFNKDVDLRSGYRTKSVLVLPVANINGEFIGALQLINKHSTDGFDEVEDARKLSLAALVCGIALESETFLEDSHHDRLTGLKNRMGFYYDFGKKYKDFLLPGSGRKMSLFICDIDKFKRVNDTYGHNAGDDVLKFTSHLIDTFCAENDGVYRWGGEEFIMIMCDADLDAAVQKAEEIRVKLMGSEIIADGNKLNCTMSFGCAVFDPQKTIEENVSAADERLYKAKETGRNKVCSD